MIDGRKLTQSEIVAMRRDPSFKKWCEDIERKAEQAQAAVRRRLLPPPKHLSPRHG